jgi:hypothetical protein
MKQKALCELGEQSSFGALCVLGGLGEQSALNGRVSNLQASKLTKDTKTTKLTKKISSVVNHDRLMKP